MNVRSRLHPMGRGLAVLVLAAASTGIGGTPANAQLTQWSNDSSVFVDLSVLDNPAPQPLGPVGAPSRGAAVRTPAPSATPRQLIDGATGLREPPSRTPVSRLLVKRPPVAGLTPRSRSDRSSAPVRETSRITLIPPKKSEQRITLIPPKSKPPADDPDVRIEKAEVSDKPAIRAMPRTPVSETKLEPPAASQQATMSPPPEAEPEATPKAAISNQPDKLMPESEPALPMAPASMEPQEEKPEAPADAKSEMAAKTSAPMPASIVPVAPVTAAMSDSPMSDSAKAESADSESPTEEKMAAASADTSPVPEATPKMDVKTEPAMSESSGEPRELRVSSVARESGPSSAPSEDRPSDHAAAMHEPIAVTFEPAGASLPDAAHTMLDSIAGDMGKDDNLRLQLLAYAGGPELSTSKARRLSLSRALAVRSYLIDKGVRSTRIDVRALGDKATEGQPNRVDILFTKR
jgi:outer membrane protein OmpA-like peptidoglycan-associated protein